MIFLVIELSGVACALSTIVFVPVVFVSKPDLEEELTEDQAPMGIGGPDSISTQ